MVWLSILRGAKDILEVILSGWRVGLTGRWQVKCTFRPASRPVKVLGERSMWVYSDCVYGGLSTQRNTETYFKRHKKAPMESLTWFERPLPQYCGNKNQPQRVSRCNLSSQQLLERRQI